MNPPALLLKEITPGPYLKTTTAIAVDILCSIAIFLGFEISGRLQKMADLYGMCSIVIIALPSIFIAIDMNLTLIYGLFCHESYHNI